MSTATTQQQAPHKQSTDYPHDLLARLLTQGDRARQLLLEGDTQAPVTVEVNPTDRCPCRCEFCIANRDADDTPAELAEELCLRSLREFQDLGGRFVTWSGGSEPTAHPAFGRMVQAVADMGLRQGLLTNPHISY